MWVKHKQQSGFTIVELLIVIVVIGILAAITIVAYNGIQERARVSALNSALVQASQKVALWQVDNSNVSPSTLSVAGVNDTDTISYQYTQTDSGAGYCITATTNATSYYISNSSGGPKQGVCSGYNLLVWNKAQSATTSPIPSAVVDTTVFRTSTASMRIGPSSTGNALRGSPFSGTIGQTYTVSFWLLTDFNWNGTSSNSKVRFGAISGGLLTACGYNGVKTSWTFITCSFTLTSTDTQTTISFGNDGNVGNIWIDDFSLTRS